MFKKITGFACIAMLLAGCQVTSSIPSSSSSLSSDSDSSSTESSSSASRPSASTSSNPNISTSLPANVESYYQSIQKDATGAKLKTSLFNLIKGHTVKSYSSLNGYFPQTDARSDGTIHDMYSNVVWKFNSKICGNYSVEGDCWNKEHSVPQSWFDKKSPMVSDMFHIYPTDGKVNGQRSNYPFGEVGSVNYTSGNGSKRGSSNFPGFSGTVFEPIDEYKGDFARTYFYMATRYEDSIRTWGSGANVSFNLSGTFPSLSQYSINLFLKWARQDPVSEKEIYRNNGVYSIQKNRNPFIDYPNFAEQIWGSLESK